VVGVVRRVAGLSAWFSVIWQAVCFFCCLAAVFFCFPRVRCVCSRCLSMFCLRQFWLVVTVALCTSCAWLSINICCFKKKKIQEREIIYSILSNFCYNIVKCRFAITLVTCYACRWCWDKSSAECRYILAWFTSLSAFEFLFHVT